MPTVKGPGVGVLSGVRNVLYLDHNTGYTAAHTVRTHQTVRFKKGNVHGRNQHDIAKQLSSNSK